MKNACLSVLAALTILFALPAVASAADTYASPNGSGEDCTKANPCSLEKAGTNLTAGARLIIEPGQYGSPASPLPYRVYTSAPGARIMGDPDATLYIDSSATDSSMTVSTGQLLRGNGMKIHSFDLQGLALIGAGTADRVWVKTTLDDSTACAMYSPTAANSESAIFNSLCFAETSSGGKGIFFHGIATEGVAVSRAIFSTGVATGTNSVGIGVENTGMSAADNQADLFVRASIANATGTGSLDLSSVNDSALNRACLPTYETASVTGGSGQCTIPEVDPIRQAPSFVSPGSDFHLKPGTALVNGIGGPADTPLEAFDLDGYPRDPANPDPGAYERQAPAASTLAASAISLTGATLNATGQTSYGTGSALFEYGPTTAYGSSTSPTPVGRSTPAQKLTQAITGLSSGASFHARIVVTSPDGDVTRGKDITFRTAAKAVCKVPKLKGLKLAKAKSRLKKANCRLGKVKRRGGKFVRKQSPKAGKVLTAGSKVKVTVGPKVKR